MSANAPTAPPVGVTWRPPRNVEYKGHMFYGPADVQLAVETVPKEKGGQWCNVAMTSTDDASVIIGRVDGRQAAPLYRELAAGRISVVPHLEWQKFNVREIWLEIDVYGSAAVSATFDHEYARTHAFK
jgi:hypothetical protein